MRKSLHQGTKADVEAMHKRIDEASRECEEMINAGINPYAAVVAMDTKINQIITYNHPWVLQ
ncbi:hypothetical protein ZN88_15575 [Salmonella enterica subsp. enterica serovar Newport]|nr:hypothetical protein [Salmonella enterica subsp. enterica serovar Newport]